MEDKSLFTYKGKTFNDFEALFNYALKLAKKKQTRDEAKEFFDAYVEFVAEANQISHEEGLKIAKSNFGYFSGYFNRETEALVNELFEAYHPCFGGRNSHDVSAKEAFEIGQKMAEEWNKNQSKGTKYERSF